MMPCHALCQTDFCRCCKISKSPYPLHRAELDLDIDFFTVGKCARARNHFKYHWRRSLLLQHLFTLVERQELVDLRERKSRRQVSPSCSDICIYSYYIRLWAISTSDGRYCFFFLLLTTYLFERLHLLGYAPVTGHRLTVKQLYCLHLVGYICINNLSTLPRLFVY